MAINPDYNPQDLLKKKIRHLIQGRDCSKVFIGKGTPLFSAIRETIADVVKVNSHAINKESRGVWISHKLLETE